MRLQACEYPAPGSNEPHGGRNVYDDDSAYAFLNLYPSNYSIVIFTHLKLCLADAIHNFKWVKIMQIWQNGDQLFSNRADWCHSKAVQNVVIIEWKPEYIRHRRVKASTLYH